MEKHLWLNVGGCTRFKLEYDVMSRNYKIYARVKEMTEDGWADGEYKDKLIATVFDDDFFFEDDRQELMKEHEPSTD